MRRLRDLEPVNLWRSTVWSVSSRLGSGPYSLWLPNNGQLAIHAHTGKIVWSAPRPQGKYRAPYSLRLDDASKSLVVQDASKKTLWSSIAEVSFLKSNDVAMNSLPHSTLLLSPNRTSSAELTSEGSLVVRSARSLIWTQKYAIQTRHSWDSAAWSVALVLGQTGMLHVEEFHRDLKRNATYRNVLPIWQGNSPHTTGPFVAKVLDSGVFIVEDSLGTIVWSTAFEIQRGGLPFCNTTQLSTVLSDCLPATDAIVQSPSGTATLTMGSTTNLNIRILNETANDAAHPLADDNSSAVPHKRVCHLILRPCGSAELLCRDGFLHTLSRCAIDGHGSYSMHLSDVGILQIQDGSGRLTWSR